MQSAVDYQDSQKVMAMSVAASPGFPMTLETVFALTTVEISCKNAWLSNKASHAYYCQ